MFEPCHSSCNSCYIAGEKNKCQSCINELDIYTSDKECISENEFIERNEKDQVKSENSF